MSREELENKLKELSEKIDGYNAKTIELKDTEQIKKASWSEWIKVYQSSTQSTMFTSVGKLR